MLSRRSPYPLWALLSILPALWLGQALGSTDPQTLEALLHPTGEMSARLLIVTLMVTPLAMLFPHSSITRWLRRHRRHLGVAAFAYAALHAAFYAADLADPGRIVAELPRLYIWTGWLAFAILVPLAATSTDWAVRRMGRRWKALQRWTYAAALLTLLHWAALHDWDGIGPALVHFAPLGLLEGWRLGATTARRRARVA
jgi:sulfoxide reductase heme-binding subunit YedZ